MMISSEKPGDPSGSFVLISPIALSVEEVGEHELQRARVLAALAVDVEEAAAADDARVDREPDAVRRLEAHVELRGPEVAAPAVGERDVGVHTDAVDRDLQGPETRLERARQLDRDAGVRDAGRQVHRLDLDRTERHVGRNRDLDRGAAFEVQPGAR